MSENARDESEFFNHARGLAIDSWANIERGLVLVFWAAIRCPDFDLASRVLHSAVNFNIRLKMTDEAVAGAFEVGLLPDYLQSINDTWVAISKDINKWARARNNIVHYVEYADEDQEFGERLYLHPSNFDRSSVTQKRLANEPRITTDKLLKSSEEFTKISRRINDYFERLPTPSALRPAFRE